MDSKNSDLSNPTFNSTSKLFQRIDQLKSKTDEKVTINESQLDRIHEKISTKLNQHGTIYDGLAPVAPDSDDFKQFLNFLETENKDKPKLKPATNSVKNNLQPPDLMEFYPSDLVKEFLEVEIEPMPKQAKMRTTKASMSLINNATENFYKWN